jgi:hypothetical protein
MHHQFITHVFNAAQAVPQIKDLLKLKLDLFRDNGIEVTGRAIAHKALLHLKVRF